MRPGPGPKTWPLTAIALDACPVPVDAHSHPASYTALVADSLRTPRRMTKSSTALSLSLAALLSACAAVDTSPPPVTVRAGHTERPVRFQSVHAGQVLVEGVWTVIFKVDPRDVPWIRSHASEGSVQLVWNERVVWEFDPETDGSGYFVDRGFIDEATARRVAKEVADAQGPREASTANGLASLALHAPELHASLAPKPLADANHGVPDGVHDSPHFSTDSDVVRSIASYASQGRLAGDGVCAALFAVYEGESELGFYGLESASAEDADRLEGQLREIWAHNVSIDRLRVHRGGNVFLIVWHDGVSAACWQSVNERLAARLTAG